MKNKYFIRGVGLGILITSIVLGIAYQFRMSEKNIVQRAKKLGMVFETELVDSTRSPEIQESTPPSEGSIVEHTLEPTDIPMDPTPNPTQKAKAKATPKPTKKASKPDYVTMTIKHGMSSKNVSDLLREKGIIKDVEKFDTYMRDSGNSVRIKVGVYKIPKGADFSAIKDIITR